MKKLIMICMVMTTLISIKLQSQFTGNLNYRNNTIDADFEVGISDYKSQGGIFYQFVVYNITINSIQVGNRELSESEIPFSVLSKLKKEMRIGSINLDLYVNNSFLKKIDTNSTVYWAELQGLDNAEGYKQAVKDKGHKLFDDGLVYIKNPVINTLTYMLDSDYRKSIEQPKGDSKNNANASNNNGEKTELGLKMPGLVVSGSESSSNNSSSDSKSSSDVESPSSDVSSYTPTYSKQEITNQVVAGVAGLAGELLNDWNANRERKEKIRDAEYTESITRDRIKLGNAFKNFYREEFESAELGNEKARMILYFASKALYHESFVPNGERWFREAVQNGNMDALLLNSLGSLYDEKIDRDAAVLEVEKIANMGSVDAMVCLADWYDSKTMREDLRQGNDPKKAFEWYLKAAEKGSPNAMYRLGMIYTYGRTPNTSGGSGFMKKMHVKYDIVPDDEVAFGWFAQSQQPNYAESTYARSNSYNKYGSTEYMLSFFDAKAYLEMAKIFRKGKVVEKNIKRAKELEALYEGYLNTQKFNNLKP